MTSSHIDSVDALDRESALDSFRIALAERQQRVAELVAQLEQGATLAETGIDLNLREEERRLLEQIARSPEFPRDWRGRVVDSILVATIWNELAPAQAEAIRAGSASTAQLLALPQFIEDCREVLRQSTDRIDGTSPTIEGLLRRADQRLNVVTESVAWATTGVSRVRHSAHSVFDDARAPERPPPPPGNAPDGSARLETFLAPALDALTAAGRSASAGALRDARLVLGHETIPAFGDSEIEALTNPGEPETSAAAAARQIFAWTSALTLECARGLGVLGGTELQARAHPSASAADLATDLDAIESLLEVVPNMRLFLENQGQIRLRAGVDAATRRLDLLARALEARVDRTRHPARRLEVTFDPERFRITTTVPSSRVRRAQPSSPPSRPVRRTPLGLARTLAVAGSLAVVATAAVVGVRSVRPYVSDPEPARLADEALQAQFSGARVLEPTATERAQRMVRIEIDADVTHIGPDELRKRVFELCRLVASSRYERAEIVDARHQRVATWLQGRVSFESTAETASSGPT